MSRVVELDVQSLARYARVPIAFEVRSVLRVEQVGGGLGGLRLWEEAVERPWVKGYDADDPPTEWARRWDLRNWALFGATDGDELIGAAAVAARTPGLQILNERDDLAALWDIRVAPPYRCRGVGRRLFEHAVGWAKSQGLPQIKIETQNVNVPACRFYAAMGCELGAIIMHQYPPPVQDEVMLLWYLDL